MATRKTPPATGAKKSEKAAKPAAKAAPVVLDPPKKTETSKPQASAVIDAKAVDVTPPPAKTDTAKPEPKAEAKPDVKPAEKPEAAVKSTGETKKPDPATEKPSQPQKPRSAVGGFIALMAGGAIAAALGYFSANLNAPPAIPDQSAEIARMQADFSAKIADLDAQIKALTEREQKAADTSGFEKDIDSLKAALAETKAGLSDRLAEAESRLQTAVADLDAARAKLGESLTVAGGQLGDTAGAIAAQYRAEVDSLKAQIDAQVKANADLAEKLQDVSDKATTQLTEARDKVTELASTAVDTVKNADMSVAVTRLQAAIETGKSYADLLAQIAKDAAVDIPEALLKPADQGVTPLLQLQQEFPEAARKGLKASIKAEAGDGIGNKLVAFVEAQLGARSLEEKPGDDPDAVLSRAEAALNRGQLQESVDLVRKLPAEGIAAMSGWLSKAEARLAAYQALQWFSDTLQPNK